MKITNWRYNLYHDRQGVPAIVVNFVKLFFLMALGRRFVTRDFFGYRFILDLKTHGLSKFVFVYKIREILDTDLVLQEVDEGMHVLDAGANIGYYALLEASRVGSKGRVYAFEPDQRNVQVLSKNVANNHLENTIKVYPWAVGRENGLGKFYLYKESNINSFVRNVKKQDIEESYVEIKMTKLDSFEFIDKVDFIRMDIEGYECFLIDGAMKFLERKKNIKMLIEVHPDVYNDQELNFVARLRVLATMGFQAKYIISAGIPRPKEIIAKGYKPLKTARELKWERGLYQNVNMEDLIEFLQNDKKIVRAILLEKHGN